MLFELDVQSILSESFATMEGTSIILSFIIVTHSSSLLSATEACGAVGNF